MELARLQGEVNLQRHPRSDVTVAQLLDQWLEAANQLGVSPVKLAEPPAFKRGAPDPPSPAEAAALLDSTWADPEWGLFLRLTMVTGSVAVSSAYGRSFDAPAFFGSSSRATA